MAFIYTARMWIWIVLFHWWQASWLLAILINLFHDNKDSCMCTSKRKQKSSAAVVWSIILIYSIMVRQCVIYPYLLIQLTGSMTLPSGIYTITSMCIYEVSIFLLHNLCPPSQSLLILSQLNYPASGAWLTPCMRPALAYLFSSLYNIGI
jgi:hypothetical protein